MPDTNDIDALLRELAQEAHRYLGETKHSRRHAAVTALVAERDALKQRVAELESHKSVSVRLLIEERDALRKRVAELESQEFTLPHDPFRDADRDLRERLVCAIWPEILRQWLYKNAIDTRGCARSDALQEADKMLAAMRKGER